MKIPSKTQEAIKRILEFHLNNAVFEFAGEFYKQIKGLPIGSAISGPIACLALAQEEQKLEEELIQENSPLLPIYRNYQRYMDDSKTLYPSTSPTEAKRGKDGLHARLDNMHPAFKFTSTDPSKVLEFLDIELSISEEGFTTRRFSKPTDKRSLLHFTSEHPNHVKRAIPYGVALRMRRLCSRQEDFIQNLIDEARILKARGYPDEPIIHGFARAMTIPRQKTLDFRRDPKNKKDNEKVRLVTTFSSAINIRKPMKKIQTFHKALQESEKLEALSFTIENVVRNPKNLRRLLLYKGIGEPVTYDGFTTCKKEKKCILCIRLGDEVTFKSPPGIFGVTLKIPTSNCSTKNCVYLCGCTLCGTKYVGQTERALKARGNEHKPQWKDQTPTKDWWTEPRKHYAEHKHHAGFWICPIYLFKEGTPLKEREHKELQLIHKLGPELNKKGTAGGGS
jgi:hypothetical protein